MCLMGAPQQRTPPFSIFQNERELDHFPRGQKIYNQTKNIIDIADRESKRDGGWEAYLSTNKGIVLYQLFWKYF